MRGNYPLPTNMKVLRGTAQPCRMNDGEVKVPKEAVTMPDGLSDDEKKHWDTVARDLEEVGILTKLDTQALKLYCTLYCTWASAYENLKKYGPVIKDKKGAPCLSPYFKVSMTAMDKMLAFLREFGMTPSSRTRVRVEQGITEGGDEFETWMKKRKIAHEGV